MARWARSPQDAVLVLVATARELGYDPDRLTVRQAFTAWATTAQVPFRVPRTERADTLVYAFGVRDGAFHVDLGRRFALREGDGHWQVRCDVVVPATAELAALGEHVETCGAAPGSAERQAWTAALGERAEWAVLDGLGAAEVVLASDSD
jgi:hypothetical protein